MHSVKAAEYLASRSTFSCLNGPLVTPLLNDHRLPPFYLPLSQSWIPHTLTQSLRFQGAIRFEAIPRSTLRPRPNGPGILGNPFLGTSSLGPKNIRTVPVRQLGIWLQRIFPTKEDKRENDNPTKKNNPESSTYSTCVTKPQGKNKAQLLPAAAAATAAQPSPAPSAAALGVREDSTFPGEEIPAPSVSRGDYGKPFSNSSFIPR